MADDCEFCAIAAGDGDAHVVHRTDGAVAFLDIYPAVPGHTLVAPTVHRDGLPEMSGDEAAATFRAVQAVAAAQQRALDADGVSVFQSSGAAAGQDVFHAHAHVLPRFVDDHIHFAPSRSTLDDEEGQQVADAIRAEL